MKILISVLYSFCLFTLYIPNANSFNIRTGSKFTMLNRILFKNEELVKQESNSPPKLRISFMDTRTQHIGSILQSRDGEKLKIGILNQGFDDSATVKWKWPDGYISGWEDVYRNEVPLQDPPLQRKAIDKLRIPPQKTTPVGIELELSSSLSQLRQRGSPYQASRVDIMLALPRPSRLSKILPILAQLGVGQIILTDADKVEKEYFGSHLLKDKNNMTLLEDALMNGLSQSGDTVLPITTVVRNLSSFLEKLDVQFPLSSTVRVIAHPSPDNTTTESYIESSKHQERYVCDIPDPCGSLCSTHEAHHTACSSRILVAVGPEGGWTNEEVDILTNQHGFIKVSLGPRILRSDVAVITSLSLAHEQIRKWDRDREKIH